MGTTSGQPRAAERAMRSMSCEPTRGSRVPVGSDAEATRGLPRALALRQHDNAQPVQPRADALAGNEVAKERHLTCSRRLRPVSPRERHYVRRATSCSGTPCRKRCEGCEVVREAMREGIDEQRVVFRTHGHCLRKATLGRSKHAKHVSRATESPGDAMQEGVQRPRVATRCHRAASRRQRAARRGKAGSPRGQLSHPGTP